MADSELSGDVTRPNPLVCELYDSLSYHVWEWPAVYEHAPELIHPTMSWRKRGGEISTMAYSFKL